MTKSVTQEMHAKFRELDPRTNLMLLEFSKEAGEFLELTERPTHIKFSVFRRYAEIFRPDRDRLKSDENYAANLSRLAQQYFTSVVNPFYPVFIHDDISDEIIGAHDRYMNHVNSADVNTDVLRRREAMEADSSAQTPAAMNSITRSFNDMLMANNTPEFMELVRQWKVESMVISTIQKRSTPETSEVLKGVTSSPAPVSHQTEVEVEDGDFL